MITTHSIRRYSLIFGLMIALLAGHVSHTQAAQFSIIFNITSTPYGADVYINDKLVGRTTGFPDGVKIPLESGMYKLKMELPGFEQNSQNIIVAYGLSNEYYISADLEPQSSLQQVIYSPNSFYWNSDNVLAITTDPPALTYIDMAQNSIAKIQPKVTGIVEQNVITSLKTTSPIIPSPSGKYYVFSYQDAERRDGVGIYNMQQKRIFKTFISPFGFNAIDSSPLFLQWSSDEKRLWVKFSDTQAVLLLQDDHVIERRLNYVTPVDAQNSNNESGKIDEVLDVSQTGDYALVSSRGVVWLVDTTTEANSARELPFKSSFSALFTDSDKEILIAHGDGLSKIDLSLKTQVMIDNVLSTRWGIYDAKLSPDGRFIAALSGSPESSQLWIYSRTP